MKRPGVFIAFIVLFVMSMFSLAVSVPAQKTFSNPLGGNLTVQDAGTCSTTGSFLWQQLPSNASTTTVNLSGTFSATVTVRLSNNGGGSWTTNQTLTSVGTIQIVTNGFTDICADVTTYTSGSVGVSLSTGIGVGVPALPAGPLNAVQVNNPLGTFGGSAALTWNGSLLTVGNPGVTSGSITLIGAGTGANLTANPSVTLGSNTLGWGGPGFSVSNLVASGSISLTGTGACATITGPTGGAWNGGGTCAGTTGASTLTITPGATAPHFWNCWGSDTTAKVAGAQSGVSGTNCTLNFASVTSGDNVTITSAAF